MNARILQIIKFFFLSLSVLVLNACDPEMNDLSETISKIKTLPAGRIEEIPEFIPYQNFEYTEQNLRDPFVISENDILDDTLKIIQNITTGIKPDVDRIKENLEDFPLDTLRFKGTVTTNDGIVWALIFAPDNTIHRVIEGYHIGQNNGRIYAVSDNKIELTEIVPDGLGNYIERNAALALLN